ncbi:MAG: hypothetical protein RR891_08810 [Clostridium sp.]|uniref:hypothetical protein n=1 Tax=Clostridium sp. TaxID=1506 RepID=UPI00303BE8B1
MGINCVQCDKTQRIIKEFNYTNELCVANCKPPVKEVLDACMKLLIIEKKIIDTCTGLKLCVKGHKLITISYEACGCSGRIVSDKFTCPFFELIPLDPCIDVLDFSTTICYCDVNTSGDHSIWFNNVISINLVVVSKTNSSPCNCDDHKSMIDCDDCTNNCDLKCDNPCNTNHTETKWNFRNDIF